MLSISQSLYLFSLTTGARLCISMKRAPPCPGVCLRKQRRLSDGRAQRVDSVSCYCKVDSGLKTVGETRKFVPGSKLFCKRWYHLLAGNFFYSLRKRFGTAEEWVYVFKRDRDGKISWNAFDPIHQLWQPLPPVPREYSEALGFSCAVLSGCHLCLFGGKDPLSGSMRCVIFYSARTNKWHRAPDMLRKCHFIGSCVINNCLYVAGGDCEGIQRTLRSAEVYDPNRNRWSFVQDMCTAMVPFIGVVYDGKWFIKGLGSHREVMNEAYDPETKSWTPVSDEMVSGWHNPSISLNGMLYALDCRDGCKLRVYDGATDSWNKFIDSKLHLGSSRALEAAALVPLNGKLCIIRNNMSISFVDVSSPDKRTESNPHLWENISGRGHFRTLFTNIWSSIAGRSGLRSHIVHCQIDINGDPPGKGIDILVKNVLLVIDLRK
ncbi:hypothetical protein CRYUN_Cryun03dG0103500 [Craigia yunnanensis]